MKRIFEKLLKLDKKTPTKEKECDNVNDKDIKSNIVESKSESSQKIENDLPETTTETITTNHGKDVRKTKMTWATERDRIIKEEIAKRTEVNRLKIVDEVRRLRETPLPNGKKLTYRDIAYIMNISRTEVGDILNGKANAKYIAKRVIVTSNADINES